MIKFEKVSFEQFKNSCKQLDCSGVLWFATDEKLREFYDAIQLPRRGTAGSAGYDFFMPFPATFTTVTPQLIPTGIRVILPQDKFLMCVPRSGLGFKYGSRLVNTCGVIDSDFSHSDNEGHIIAKIVCDKAFDLKQGDRFMQGIILSYSITDDDDPINGERNGGFGSTGGT